MTPDAARVIEEARTFLFVPGNRPERFGKALASGADAIIIDLEDAVAASEKAAARAAIDQAWGSLAERGRVLIRINAAGTPFFGADLALCHSLKPAAIVLPKARAATLAQMAGNDKGHALVPLIESAAALSEVDSIAQHARTLRLAFGHLDFQADLGMRAGDDEAELAPARFAIVLASRIAGRAAPIDGITLETSNDERVTLATLRARRFGFGARLCIHPRQVAAVHAAFAPSSAELEWARRVVDAVRASSGAGGAIQVDGQMVDRPVIAQAERLLAHYADRRDAERDPTTRRPS